MISQLGAKIKCFLYFFRN